MILRVVISQDVVIGQDKRCSVVMGQYQHDPEPVRQSSPVKP